MTVQNITLMYTPIGHNI